MNGLGVLYIQGQGVAQSNALAREWLTKAANEGQEGTIPYLKILDEQEGKSTTATAPTTATTTASTTSLPPPETSQERRKSI